MEAADSEPGRDGRLASGDHERDALGQRGHERLPQPGIHEPKDLVVVERNDSRCALG
jgi:hypothetical protein